MIRIISLFATTVLIRCALAQSAPGLSNTPMAGYRGIWFALNQPYPHGDKYSGALGTYTAKHMPLAVYAPEVKKTFFVYGGTTEASERHLLCMAGAYDHRKKTVSQPTVVYDKLDVNDPHDNPSVALDADGYVWVFVSGRGNTRQGVKLRSRKPYDIAAFDIVSEETFTYPQIWKTPDGFFHFFTKYTGVRELYIESSKDGRVWTPDVKLAGIREGDLRAGHYQVSGYDEKRNVLGTFFNRHRDGDPDTRTDLYYVQSADGGKSWTDVHRKPLVLPLTTVDVSARVIDYQAMGKNVYMKDMNFDEAGRPMCLYVTSNGHEPGPGNAPYEWRLTFFDGDRWITRVLTTSDHNYDMGSLFVEGMVWRVVAPTDTGPQPFGVGGEIVSWVSRDRGLKWEKDQVITRSSAFNHSYVRRPLKARAPFQFFWASGDAHRLSISELYFGDFNGRVWKLPYTMNKGAERPERVRSKR